MPVLAVFSVFVDSFLRLIFVLRQLFLILAPAVLGRRDGSIRALRKRRFRNKTQEVAIFQNPGGRQRRHHDLERPPGEPGLGGRGLVLSKPGRRDFLLTGRNRAPFSSRSDVPNCLERVPECLERVPTFFGSDPRLFRGVPERFC